MKDLLQIKTEDDVVFLSLNRPEKRNALNPPLIQALLDFFKEQKWPISTKAIVLSGEGPAFCSGADLKYLKNLSSFNKEDLEKIFSLLQAMESCPLPVIAVVRGFAVGGGLGLLSVSDVVIAEDNARFLFSETRLGLVPSIISPFVLKKMGLSWSRFWMLSTKAFSAREAWDRGLVHFVGTDKEGALYLKELLKSFKELEPLALSETKKWLNYLSSLSLGSAYAVGDFPSGSQGEEEALSSQQGIKQKAIELIHKSRQRPITKERIKTLVLKKNPR